MLGNLDSEHIFGDTFFLSFVVIHLFFHSHEIHDWTPKLAGKSHYLIFFLYLCISESFNRVTAKSQRMSFKKKIIHSFILPSNKSETIIITNALMYK